MSGPDPVLEAAVQALRIEGGDPGSSIHGWRCEYPDRYGPCNCVAESAAEILAAVRPLIEAEVREAVARELDERGENMDKAANAAGDRGNYEAAIRMGGLADTYREAARIARGSDGWATTEATP